VIGEGGQRAPATTQAIVPLRHLAGI